MNIPALRAQFEKEREFAKLIMAAPSGERKHAYSFAYAELYRLFPDLQTDPAEEENRVRTSLQFMAPFLRRSATVLEIGAGRGHLAIGLAGQVAEVMAFDVAPLSDTSRFPPHLRYGVFDGLSLPVQARSVDVVVSDNVLEHLHPDDARQQMTEALRVLKAEGHLVLLTPNKANGPHDISTFFSPVPAGLHLKEYASRDVRALLRGVGFDHVRAYIGAKGIYLPVWPAVGSAVEFVAGLLPRRVTRSALLRWLLPNRFTAKKPA